MVTFGTKERYGEYDWRFGATGLVVGDLPVPAGRLIEYHQDEFRNRSMYCTLYACFGAYSILTGQEIDIDTRLDIIHQAITGGVVSDID